MGRRRVTLTRRQPAGIRKTTHGPDSPSPMNISLNASELKQLLELTPPTHNIMLTGRHGIGKSEILREHFRRKELPVVALFLGQMSDPGDLIGLPQKDEATGKTIFLPPAWFPTDGQPIVLFLDELNRARPELLQTVMDLALNRRLAGRELPPGSRIISAVNAGEEYQLTDLDPALVSRFNIYHFRPTVGEWLLWAAQAGLDQRVIEFISTNSSFLDGDGTPDDSDLDKTPDRRAWKRVSDIMAGVKQLDAVHRKAIAGIIGLRAAARFHEALEATLRISAKDVLLHFNKHEDALKLLPLHELSRLNESLYCYIETELKPTAKNKATVTHGLERYATLLLDNNMNEAFAHWASLYAGGNYPVANLFILTETPKLYGRIRQFIAEL